MDADYDHAARHLQLALCEAFAPQIDNPQSMKFANGLREGKTERELGLESVPISVVYSAMFAFLKLQAPVSEDLIRKIACGMRQVGKDMADRSLGEESTSDQHGLCIEAHGQYADRVNGFAAELEAALPPPPHAPCGYSEPESDYRDHDTGAHRTARCEGAKGLVVRGTGNDSITDGTMFISSRPCPNA